MYEKAVAGQLVSGSGKSKKAKASKPGKEPPAKLVEDVLLLPADAASEVLQDTLDGKLKITDVANEVKTRLSNVCFVFNVCTYLTLSYFLAGNQLVMRTFLEMIRMNDEMNGIYEEKWEDEENGTSGDDYSTITWEACKNYFPLICSDEAINSTRTVLNLTNSKFRTKVHSVRSEKNIFSELAKKFTSLPEPMREMIMKAKHQRGILLHQSSGVSNNFEDLEVPVLYHKQMSLAGDNKIAFFTANMNDSDSLGPVGAYVKTRPALTAAMLDLRGVVSLNLSFLLTVLQTIDALAKLNYTLLLLYDEPAESLVKKALSNNNRDFQTIIIWYILFVGYLHSGM